MLKEANKLRLDTVLAVLEENKLRFPNAEIAKKTGENKGNVSAFLKGKKPIPDNFFTTFMEAFSKQPKGSIVVREEKPDSLYNLTESNKKLADSQLIFAEAHLKLAENTVKLTSMLEDKMRTNSSALPENPLTDQSILKGVLAALVQVGIGKNWRTKSEGEAVVRSLIFGDLKSKKQADTQSSVGK